MGNGLCLLDGARRVVVANDRFADLMGLASADLAPGREIAPVLPAPLPAAGPAGEPSAVEMQIGARDLELLRTPVEQGGEVLLAQDVSRRKQVEHDLRDACDRTERAMRAKGAFLANMSHEVRTPIHSVLGFLELALEAKELPAPVRRNLEIADRSAGGLLRIIDGILDLSRLESGAVTLENLPLSLPECLEAVHDMLHLKATEKGLALSATLDEGVPEWVAGDPTRLRQILLNLAGNAVKFTDAGRGEVHVSVEPGPQALLRFEVRDTGIGIAPERLEAIFEPFSQEDASTTRRYGGSGPGTTICRELVELMGGRIWADSRPGEGAVFTFLLPLPRVAPPRPEPQPSMPAPAPAAGATVLVVEDVAEIRMLLDLHLRRRGHRVLQAGNGAEGLETFRRIRPDLVLMDMQMPVMEGLAAAAAMRAVEAAAPAARPVPIVGLSASATPSDRDSCLAAGMTDLAAKPVNFRRLMALIDSYLADGPLRPAPAAPVDGTARCTEARQAMAI